MFKSKKKKKKIVYPCKLQFTPVLLNKIDM